MGWFKGLMNEFQEATTETTEELQAQLNGLCHKIVAQGFGWTEDMKKYERLITELTRRGETPCMTVKPTKGGGKT